MLLIFGGLPGVGKSTIARLVAAQLHAVYLRVDTIEQALRNAGIPPVTEGYLIAYAIAAENLRLGATVVADSVNPLSITRDAWRSVAEQAGTPAVEIEVICSDPTEHQRRVETRTVDVLGLILPSWHDVQRRHYEPWPRPRLVLDTTTSTAEACAAAVMRSLDKTLSRAASTASINLALDSCHSTDPTRALAP